jgi:hypothetical protein
MSKLSLLGTRWNTTACARPKGVPLSSPRNVQRYLLYAMKVAVLYGLRGSFHFFQVLDLVLVCITMHDVCMTMHKSLQGDFLTWCEGQVCMAHCKENLLNCCQLTCSHASITWVPLKAHLIAQWLCMMHTHCALRVKLESNSSVLHVNWQQLSKFSLQWHMNLWHVIPTGPAARMRDL